MASIIKADTLQSTTANVFVLNSSGTEYARFDSSGNMGIGTASPGAKLDVKVGTGNFTVGLQGAGNALLTASSTMQLDAAGASSAMVLKTVGTERMRIDSSGNVGIGNSSPAVPLQIGNGTANATLRFGATSNGYDIGRDNATGQFIQNATQASPYNVFIWQQSGTERMRIDSSGNVGIGTSSPSGRLNIAVGASTSCIMRFTSNDTGTGAGDRGRLDFYSADNSGVAYQLGYMDYDRADGTGTASYIAWASRVSGTVAERMRIDSSGNLKFNSGYGSVATAYACRAWVNFNGTGTVAIRASGNVTSITDNGTGDYTVNFTTAMPDVNFSGTVSGSGNVNGQHCPVFLGQPGSNDTSSHPTTSAFRFSFYNVTNSTLRADQTMINVAIFR